MDKKAGKETHHVDDFNLLDESKYLGSSASAFRVKKLESESPYRVSICSAILIQTQRV